MFDDGDDILDLVGIALVITIVLSIGVLVLAGVTAPSRSDAGPDVEWSLERHDNGTVSVIHDGGEPVKSSNIVVEVDGLQRQVTWDGVIDDGDEVRLDADTGQVVRVYWDPGQGDRTLLESWRI